MTRIGFHREHDRSWRKHLRHIRFASIGRSVWTLARLLEALQRLVLQPEMPRMAVAVRRPNTRGRAVTQRLELNDHLLKDIGFTRVDFHHAASRRVLPW